MQTGGTSILVKIKSFGCDLLESIANKGISLSGILSNIFNTSSGVRTCKNVEDDIAD